ncbi:aminodeoxychorismate synthase component I [Kiloniella sp. b19]|uniref:aminodeoxychorismate synthase component I n=1 Tax=Kiloniella sp. GXU_MW_B19 TaxID=3141326 RepID=UPI0031D4BC8E
MDTTSVSQRPELLDDATLQVLVESARKAPFVMLEDTLHGKGAKLFTAPQEIISCSSPRDVREALDRIDLRQSQGFYLAGFMSYELGYVFEERLNSLLPADSKTPLLWFGVFEAPQVLTPEQADQFLGALRQNDCRVDNLVPSMEQADYEHAIQRVRDFIAAGDTYQVNFTFKHRFEVTGDTTALYQQLRQRQPVAHGAMVFTGEQRILSLSPELFIKSENGLLTTRPMKGTTPRGTTPLEDDENRTFLTRDPKSRAENLMIVDLLRNDIGRVSETGSVRVTELFTVETYKSLHQMTSNVTGRRRENATTSELIRRLFPCGSITGAPKVRTMEIIRELEQEPRGLYTGSIGMIEPNGDLYFNVAIRTLVMDKPRQDGKAVYGELGIGSGIVYDSVPTDEYHECLLKGRFLSANQALQDEALSRPLSLIETLRWTETGGYWLLAEHLERLQHSAGFFGFPFNAKTVRETLENLDASAGALQRVRLLLDRDGSCSLSTTVLDQSAIEPDITFAVSQKTVDSGNPLFYHKTTRREFYEDELAQCAAQTGCDEVLFLNERGEVTEGARTNIFVEKDGRLFTPALNSGLLNGVLRRHLLRTGYRDLQEQLVTLEDIRSADRIYFGNSVRGLMQASEIRQPRG